MDLPNNVEQRGKGNVQQVGDGNINGDVSVFVVLPEVRVLPQTEIFTLLEIFRDSNIPVDAEFSLLSPSEINEKLKYNNANRHIAYFEDYFDIALTLGSVVEEFPNSERIVRKLRTLFKNIANIDSDGTLQIGDGDAQLTVLHEDITTLLVEDPRFEQSILKETLDDFVKGLLIYGVMKCKVLLPIPQIEEKE